MRTIPVSQFDNPIGQEEKNGSQQQPRNAKDKVGNGRRRLGIAALVDLQEIFKKIIKSGPHIPQAVDDDQESGRPDHNAKQFGCFHILFPAKPEPSAFPLSMVIPSRRASGEFPHVLFWQARHSRIN
jgi:hypothetical protein